MSERGRQAGGVGRGWRECPGQSGPAGDCSCQGRAATAHLGPWGEWDLGAPFPRVQICERVAVSLPVTVWVTLVGTPTARKVTGLRDDALAGQSALCARPVRGPAGTVSWSPFEMETGDQVAVGHQARCVGTHWSGSST